MNLDFGAAIRAGTDTASGLINQSIKEDYDARAEQRAANNKVDVNNRMLAAEQMMKDQARVSRANRIDAAQQQLLQQGTVDKANAQYDYTNDDGTSSPASYDELPDEDKAKFAPSDKDKAHAYTQAAIKTGDIDPKEAASLTSKEDLAEFKNASAAEKNAMLERIANVRAEAMRDTMQARLDAAKEKAANGKIDTATGRMLITSEDANIRASTSQMNMLSQQLQFARKEEKAGIQAQINQLQDDISTSKQTKNLYMKQMGYPTADDLPKPDKPAAAPSAPIKALPAGAKQIGTSGGKPVYEVNGKRFIQQ